MYKFFLLGLSIVFFAPTLAAAHVLQATDTFGAVIHIDPNDEPVSGLASSIFIDLKNKDDTFRVADCVCVVTISKGNELLQTTEITAPFPQGVRVGDKAFTLPYTFPTEGEYKIKIAGIPKPGAPFSPFDFTFDAHVKKGSAVGNAVSSLGDHPVSYTLFGLALGSALSVALYNKFRRAN